MLIHEFILVNKNEIPHDALAENISYNLTKTRECVKVSDDIIVNNSDFLSSFKTHWSYTGNIHEGLDYHGITIILNEDIKQFVDVLAKYSDRNDVQKLDKLCRTALIQNKNIVHFGI